MADYVLHKLDRYMRQLEFVSEVRLGISRRHSLFGDMLLDIVAAATLNSVGA